MIFQENEFLKTYNNMTKIWEAFDLDTPIAFKEVTDHLKTFTGELTSEELDFWRRLRQVVLRKRVRHSDFESTSWYRRFVTFYKSYLVEDLILSKINELSGCSIQLQPNGVNNDKLFINTFDLADEKEAHNSEGLQDFSFGNSDELKQSFLGQVPDGFDSYIAELLGRGVECKAVTATSSLHGAHFVIRYSTISEKTKTVKFYFTGELQDLCAIFAPQLFVELVDHPRRQKTIQAKLTKQYPYLCAVDGPRSLKYGASQLKSDQVKAISIDLPAGYLAQMEQQLSEIDKLLNKNTEAKSDYATYVLNTYTKDINGTIQKLSEEPILFSTDSTNAKEAEVNLKLAVDQLVDVVT